MSEDNWFRQLQDGRLEIFLKRNGVKLRASGPEEVMFKLVTWFEEIAECEVVSPMWRRPPRQASVIEGQLMLEYMPELSSDATVVDHG